MNRFEDMQVWITFHAHKQYCKRVQEMEHEMLQYNCTEQLHAGNYDYNSKDFLHLGGVWWIYEFHNEEGIFFTTCYGKTNIDMPKAIAWAARNHDRINLSGSAL